MKPRNSLFLDGFEQKINSDFVERPHSLFLEIEAFSTEHNVPSMSPASGKVLQSLVRWRKPRSVLELGTGIGYSTLWMLTAIFELKVVTLDRREAQAQKLLEYADKLGIKREAIQVLALDIVDWCQKQGEGLAAFDFVLVDCDKVNYPVLAELLWNRLKPGSTIVFDNMLWHGRIFLNEASKPSDLAIQEVWAWAKSLNAPYTLIPVGDGLLVLEKP